MNVPPYGDGYKRVGAYFSNLQVTAQTVPGMTVKISAGGFWYYSNTGASYVEYVGGNSPAMTAPVGNAKWVIITIGQSGIISIVDGSPGAHPVLPAVPGKGRIPLAAIYINAGTTSITNDIIFDIRPLFPMEVRDHSDLEGTGATGLHPITSISGLVDSLAQLVSMTALAAYLADKADKTGTVETNFILNKDYTGTPGSDCLFEIERGSESNTALKWDEYINKWRFTDDGSAWITFSDFYLNDGTQELKILSYTQATEPDLAADSNMAIWVDSSVSNRVYLVYRRGTADQVKIELT